MAAHPVPEHKLGAYELTGLQPVVIPEAHDPRSLAKVVDCRVAEALNPPPPVPPSEKVAELRGAEQLVDNFNDGDCR